jgi:hypothetical protein
MFWRGPTGACWLRCESEGSGGDGVSTLGFSGHVDDFSGPRNLISFSDACSLIGLILLILLVLPFSKLLGLVLSRLDLLLML